jgi:hypothetical protein
VRVSANLCFDWAANSDNDLTGLIQLLTLPNGQCKLRPSSPASSPRAVFDAADCPSWRWCVSRHVIRRDADRIVHRAFQNLLAYSDRYLPQ